MSLPPHCSSPRTRIRTTLPVNDRIMGTSLTMEPTMFSLCDYQGGREAPADTEKSKEQLYTEAKEILALGGGRTPTESPNNTGPRRPPRSKHDSHATSDMMPSSEAPSRMLIGTMMLNK